MPPGFNEAAENPALNSGHRTTSFADLAAVIGEGLVESMDDSFMEFANVRKYRMANEVENNNGGGGGGALGGGE